MNASTENPNPTQVDTMTKDQIRALINEVAEVLQQHIDFYRWADHARALRLAKPSRAQRGHLYRARNHLLYADMALAFGYARSLDRAITYLNTAAEALRAVESRHSLAELDDLYPPF